MEENPDKREPNFPKFYHNNNNQTTPTSYCALRTDSKQAQIRKFTKKKKKIAYNISINPWIIDRSLRNQRNEFTCNHDPACKRMIEKRCSKIESFLVPRDCERWVAVDWNTVLMPWHLPWETFLLEAVGSVCFKTHRFWGLLFSI